MTKCDFTTATCLKGNNYMKKGGSQIWKKTSNGHLKVKDTHECRLGEEEMDYAFNTADYEDSCLFLGTDEREYIGDHAHSCANECVSCRCTAIESNATKIRPDNTQHGRTQLSQCLRQLSMCRRAIASSHSEILSLKECTSLLADELSSLRKLTDENLPVTITVENFTSKKANEEVFYSKPFYSHPRGYKMCLKVNPNALGECPSSHVSVFIKLLHGPHDDQLHWPFVGSVRIELLDQLTGRDHHCYQLLFHKEDRKFPGNHLGKTRFISHASLLGEGAGHACYLKDGRMYFRIRVF